jgi:hypothetical protein
MQTSKGIAFTPKNLFVPKGLASACLPQRLAQRRFWVSEGLSALSDLTGIKSVNIKKMTHFQ